MTSWAQERRLKLVVDKALEDVRERNQIISGKDRHALQMEWLEFFAVDWEDLEVIWWDYFQEWEA